MKTRITTLPKKCLKFEAYIFLPDNNASIRDLRYHASRTPGNLIVYDEYGKKIVKRYAFDSLSEAMAVVEKIRRGMVYKRTKGVLRK